MRIVVLTTFAMIAFAGNSLLCRAALKYTTIDSASFTTMRLVAGAAMLWIIVALVRRKNVFKQGNWISACALFAYAAGFSLAYRELSAATGALLLFGAVQITMIGYALIRGERMRRLNWMGVVLALGGLVGLLIPGLSAPPLAGAGLMLVAGFAWGVYSLRGKGAGDALQKTAGNFLRTVPITLAFCALAVKHATFDMAGILYAIASGAITSGVGYAIWYSALPSLRATSAATVQLSVPVITAFGGVVLLSETITLRLVLASIAVLFGIALVLRTTRA